LGTDGVCGKDETSKANKKISEKRGGGNFVTDNRGPPKHTKGRTRTEGHHGEHIFKRQLDRVVNKKSKSGAGGETTPAAE